MFKSNTSEQANVASLTTITTPAVNRNTVPEPVDNSGLNLVDGSAVSSLTDVDETKTEESKPEEIKIDATVTIDLSQNAQEASNVIAKSLAAEKAIETKKNSETPATIYTAAPVAKSASEKTAEKKAADLNKNIYTGKSTPKTAGIKDGEIAVRAKYWVQAASYTSKKTADLARATLDENRIPAEVFTYKDGKNNLFYRVRVGPYMTKSEAEYWQNRICKIDSFKDSKSYITVN